MKKQTLIFLTFIIIALTACGNAPRSTSANSNFATQNGSATGELPATTQIALGTLKLDGTDHAITAEQASNLLPLWETMQVLENSDTAAQQEIEALSTQIQETMTKEQMQTITAMNLTRQDMFAVMQAQGGGTGNSRQFGNTQNGNSSGNGNRNPGGGFGPGAGGPPPDGGGFQGFGGQGQNRSASQIATAQAARQARGGNRLPAPLINAMIEFLKKKAGS